MRALAAALGLGLFTSVTGTTTLTSASTRSALPIAAPNRNTASGGTIRDGVFTIALEAKRALWHPDGDSLPGRETTAFAEAGKEPSIPGPLIRVPAGTDVRMTVRNAEVSDTLRFVVPPQLLGKEANAALDTLRLGPGQSGELRFTAASPGNFYYRAQGNDVLSGQLLMHGLLAGAIVVDSAGAIRLPNERIFVMSLSIDSVDGFRNANFLRAIFAINGRSWPHTERLSATVGDTLRWRIINLNNDIHPMHLHGFYFRVEDYVAPGAPQAAIQSIVGRMAVTERLPAFARMTMSWVPERPGNWLLHCHFALHLVPIMKIGKDGPAAYFSTPSPQTAAAHAHDNHAMTGMAGLVMGITVNPRPGEPLAEPARGRRQLRLVATSDSGFPDSVPSLRFRLEERERVKEAGPAFSPPLVLARGEPVSITVVNKLREPTAVHWHGIELESYFDGVAGFGGFGQRISPIIAPRDSFEVRFTPPRAGTFMYHSHIKEVRQHAAGLLGALVVVDGAREMPPDDHAFLLKAPRTGPLNGALIEVNGQINPDTIVVHAGRTARFRFINLTAVNPNAAVSLTARRDSSFRNGPDSLAVRWQPAAKDGADLPPAARIPRIARQVLGMGETYDFEYTPAAPGILRLEVRQAGANGTLLARVPVRVE